jgi:hypothetical protein
MHVTLTAPVRKVLLGNNVSDVTSIKESRRLGYLHEEAHDNSVSAKFPREDRLYGTPWAT